jgi:hypothetical protein
VCNEVFFYVIRVTCSQSTCCNNFLLDIINIMRRCNTQNSTHTKMPVGRNVSAGTVPERCRNGAGTVPERCIVTHQHFYTYVCMARRANIPYSRRRRGGRHPPMSSDVTGCPKMSKACQGCPELQICNIASVWCDGCCDERHQYVVWWWCCHTGDTTTYGAVTKL